MRLSSAFVIACLTLGLALWSPNNITGPAVAATAAAAGTPPPQIYRAVSRPLCTELHTHVLPAVAMVLQNDQIIQKSLPIFDDYTRTAYQNSSKSADDTTDYDSPGRAMALMQMDQLVGPLSRNVIAIQKTLQNTTLATSSGKPEDDAHLKAVREDLLKVLGAQSASLDIINGFVETERLGDMQHQGQEYLSDIQGTETQSSAAPEGTPMPYVQDPNQPGLAPNPYNIDPAAMPGLQVGYNPISRILEVFTEIRQETQKREDTASKSILTAGKLCANHPNQ
ncbi:MAG TPA: hypothetical protein VGX91_12195 [Candidatus Cybelea sp.]|jgi:hypothetical protein|nr:hypothetical protein [Candidatus Cybelea sp.]